MILTLELTPEQETALQSKALLAGLDISTYAMRLLADAALPAHDGEESLYDSLSALGMIGIAEGASRPGDGRGWSEIEAARDPV